MSASSGEAGIQQRNLAVHHRHSPAAPEDCTAAAMLVMSGSKPRMQIQLPGPVNKDRQRHTQE